MKSGPNQPPERNVCVQHASCQSIRRNFLVNEKPLEQSILSTAMNPIGQPMLSYRHFIWPLIALFHCLTSRVALAVFGENPPEDYDEGSAPFLLCLFLAFFASYLIPVFIWEKITGKDVDPAFASGVHGLCWFGAFVAFAAWALLN
jgi:hypothetical protein